MLDAHRLERGLGHLGALPHPVAALALHQLVALDGRASQQPALDLGTHRLDPVLDHVRVSHHPGKVVLVRRLRHNRVEVGQHVLTQGGACGLGTAPLAALGGRHQLLRLHVDRLRRRQHADDEIVQLVRGAGVLRLRAQPGLADHHPDALKVVGHL